jgi:hypothetical protein
MKKKRLPQKIAVKRSEPALNNKESGITELTYVPPKIEKDGLISFKFGNDTIESKIRLVDK